MFFTLHSENTNVLCPVITSENPENFSTALTNELSMILSLNFSVSLSVCRPSSSVSTTGQGVSDICISPAYLKDAMLGG